MREERAETWLKGHHHLKKGRGQKTLYTDGSHPQDVISQSHYRYSVHLNMWTGAQIEHQTE